MLVETRRERRGSHCEPSRDEHASQDPGAPTPSARTRCVGHVPQKVVQERRLWGAGWAWAAGPNSPRWLDHRLTRARVRPPARARLKRRPRCDAPGTNSIRLHAARVRRGRAGRARGCVRAAGRSQKRSPDETDARSDARTHSSTPPKHSHFAPTIDAPTPRWDHERCHGHSAAAPCPIQRRGLDHAQTSLPRHTNNTLHNTIPRPIGPFQRDKLGFPSLVSCSAHSRSPSSGTRARRWRWRWGGQRRLHERSRRAWAARVARPGRCVGRAHK